MQSTAPAVIEGADLLLERCGTLRAGETVAIVCDAEKRWVADVLESRAKRKTRSVRLIEIPRTQVHGQEPPSAAAELMVASDLCIGVTTMSLAHTRARLNAALRGARYLSLPDYSLDLLASPALRVDYHARAVHARRLAAVFSAGRLVRVTSAAGTDVTLRIDGRKANCCPGFVTGPGELGSPPDIEANVSPLEDSANGVIVVDGSVPHPDLGLLEQPIKLVVRHGRVVSIEGTAAQTLERLFQRVDSPGAYVLAECGVGLNDRATLCGIMLVDEGAAGTLHFGFGSNAMVGGLNDVPFHLDFVCRSPTLTVDDVEVLVDGELC